ncbi:site-specific integrase [Enterococcus casseliflavus]|uniref:tyrosine-type recombinase/integrase n=1 Tax=Enterococcus casseliflavus TaxID=37734 RepID=UPI003016869A
MAYKKIEEVTDEFWENEINKENREIIDEFLDQSSHLSAQTLKQYKSGLRIFAKWIYDENKNKPIYKLKPRDGLKYQNYLVKLGLSASAIKFKRSSVSSLCGYIENFLSDEEEYANFRNIFNKHVPSVTPARKKEKVPLNSKEVKKIVKVLEERKDYQKLAYFSYTFDTGCRREESRQLLKEVGTYKQVVDREGTPKPFIKTHMIRAKGRGKDGKVRDFKYSLTTQEYFQKWLKQRAEFCKERGIKDDVDHMFVYLTKTSIKQASPTAFNDWCEVFSEIVGRHIHPHLLRSSRATIAIVEEGKDIKSVQKLLGHQDSSTTEIYIVRDDTDDEDELF